MTDAPTEPDRDQDQGHGKQRWLSSGVADVAAASLFSDAGHELATRCK